MVNLAGHGVWEAARGRDAPNSVVGQPGVDNSAMGRGEVGTMRGRAWCQGIVRGRSRWGGNARGRGV